MTFSASGTQWHGVFLAEAGGENGSRVTLAENAIVIAEPKQGKLELHLQGGSTHEFDRADPNHYSVTAFGQSDWPIEVSGLVPSKAAAARQSRSGRCVNWRVTTLLGGVRRASRCIAVLAFPVACLAFALIAVPLGAQPRRGGRAAGSLIAVVLIASYYLLLIMGAGMARQGTVTPAIGMWIANAVLVVAGLALLPRMEQFRGEIGWLQAFGRFKTWMRLIRVRTARVRTAAARIGNGRRTQGNPAENIQRQLAFADGFVSAPKILRVFRDTHVGVRLFIRGFYFFSSYSTTSPGIASRSWL